MEDVVQFSQQRWERLLRYSPDFKLFDEASRLKWRQAEQCINRLTKDLLGRGRGHHFDVHPANRTHHAHRLPQLPINHESTVQFLHKIAAFFNQHTLDDLALWTSLWCDQTLT